MNPYHTLGVARGASDEEIRKRYRKLCLELHPDRNPDDPSAEEKFKEVSSAYQILSDPDKRRSYELGHDVFVNPDAQEVVQQFMRFFGDFLESSPLFDVAEEPPPKKKKRKAKAKKKRKKDGAGTPPKPTKRKAKQKPKCAHCHDRKTVRMRQGGFEVSVPCRRCPK